MPFRESSCARIMLTKHYAVAAVVAISAYYVMADGGAHGHVPHADPHAHAPVHHEPAVSYSEPQYYSRKCSLIDVFWVPNRYIA